jgi:tetratricopeptide (TPR) repeat protein
VKAFTPLLSGSVAPATFSAVRWRAAVLCSFVVVYFTLQIGSYSQKSATYDEPVHLAAGYASLVNGDHRVDPCHPPFVRMWAALPLLAMPGVKFDSSAIDAAAPLQSLGLQNTFAHGFLYKGQEADRMLNRARFMIVLLGALLGLLVFFWAQEWLGFPIGALALGCYLLSPNLGAHAALVTTDFGITCFAFGTVYFLWRTARAFTAWNVAGLAGFFALATIAKFSAVLLAPICALLLMLAPKAPAALTWRRVLLVLGLMAAAAWLAIWAVYGFRYEPSATPGWLYHTRDVPGVMRESPTLFGMLNWIDAHRLLPNSFTQGLILNLSLSGNAPAYLGGEISRGGWWYYFPFAILVKTPIPLLALVFVGFGALLWRLRSRAMAWDALCLLLPVAIYLGFAMSTSISLGLRHVLPLYPFLLMIAGVAGSQILSLSLRPQMRWGILAGMLGLWIASYAQAYPHTLTFFNLAAGGPKRGADHLVDSNLDWGQHLKLLKKWMDAHGVARINLAYFGTADPEYGGISAVMLPGTRDYLAERVAQPELPGYVAISETIASGVHIAPEWRQFYRGFDALTPVAVLGHTLKVYRIDQWPDPGRAGSDDALVDRAVLAERLRGMRWPAFAALFYRNYLQHVPDDLAVYLPFAQALFDAGDREAADRAHARALELARGRFDHDRQIAGRLIARGQFLFARSYAHALTQLRPNDPAARDVLGIALAGNGQLADAQKEFEAAVSGDPSNPVFRHHLDRAMRQRAETR